MAEKKNVKVVKYARRGQWRDLVRTLDKGASVNATDEKRRSALFLAALNGKKKCVKELLKRGADPNQRTLDGQTACHAAALGGRSPRFPNGIMTKNPLVGLFLWSRGVFNLLVYHLHDAQLQCSCLEHLVECGGDVSVQSFARETTRDIAVRMRKMAIVTAIENHYNVQATRSGLTIEEGQSMLRPSNSFPHACPRWMHMVASATSLEEVSPASSSISLYQQGRCTDIYDYGFVYPYGSRTSPGSIGAVPEVLFSEIEKCFHSRNSVDGSIWQQAYWGGQAVVIRQFSPTRARVTADLVLLEMDTLSLLRHPNVPVLMAVSCGPIGPDLCLVLEPISTSSLHHQLHHQHKKHSVLAKMKIMTGVASAVDYLHSMKGLVHCILSSHAIHLSPSNTPKLCNMYCCLPPDTHVKKGPHFHPFIPWMAPELMQHLTTSYTNDIYSFGVLAWELWGEEEPWAGLSPKEVWRVVIREGQRLSVQVNHSGLSPLLEKCLGTPSQRVSITEVSKLLSAISDQSNTYICHHYSQEKMQRKEN